MIRRRIQPAAIGHFLLFSGSEVHAAQDLGYIFQQCLSGQLFDVTAVEPSEIRGGAGGHGHIKTLKKDSLVSEIWATSNSTPEFSS